MGESLEVVCPTCGRKTDFCIYCLDVDEAVEQLKEALKDFKV